MIFTNSQSGEKTNDAMAVAQALDISVTSLLKFVRPDISQEHTVDPMAREIPSTISPWTFEEDDTAAKSAAIRAAQVQLQLKLQSGVAVGALHVAIDAESRGNLQAVVLAAGLVVQGQATWQQQDGSALPDFRDYARGWISMEGDRIPLDTPQDGVGLALKASARYAALVQHEQDLENDIKAASDPSTVDVTAGWPE